MLVSLEQVKQLLGIDLIDTSEDDHLTQLILAATVWIESETHWRFDVPIEKTEYQNGTGRRELFLRGHIDLSTPPVAESAFDSTPHVAERLIGDLGAWDDLVEGEDYERRGDTLLSGNPTGFWWDRGLEFRIIYMDGFWEAPEDIQQLLLEIVTRQYNTDIDLAAGTAGITSEHIGDYSYTLDLGAVAAISGSSITDTGWLTINHYKRRLV